MSPWTKNVLNRIAETDDLHIAPLREDGITYGTPTWVWSVAVAGSLYVRAYNGRRSTWYRAALRQRAGRVTAAGVTTNVSFEAADGPPNDRIDEAYAAKYSGSPYLQWMTSEHARAATVKVEPLDRDVASRELRS